MKHILNLLINFRLPLDELPEEKKKTQNNNPIIKLVGEPPALQTPGPELQVSQSPQQEKPKVEYLL